MSTYCIGDLQGCYDPLMTLLDKIQFDEAKDTLWFTGDLINRGPKSLQTLRFVKSLGSRHRIVLGNHDLHLLASYHQVQSGGREDTFSDILLAPDRDELLSWLQHLPLMHYDAELNMALVHASLASSWTVSKALSLAREVESILQSPDAVHFLKNMYGNQPDLWSDDLVGWDRLRCITNYFTRARFCYADGRLDLKHKGTVESCPANLMPWYLVPNRANIQIDIVFGHWAALGGVTHTPNVFAVDTGCVWGFNLTALRLEDRIAFQTACG